MKISCLGERKRFPREGKRVGEGKILDGRYAGMYERMKSCGMEERYLVGESYITWCGMMMEKITQLQHEVLSIKISGLNSMGAGD